MRPVAVAAIVVLALAGGAAVYYFMPGAASKSEGGGAHAGPPKGFAMPVEAAKAKSGPLVRSILAVGTLRSNQGVVIRPEIAGRIAKIPFREGQKVPAGTKLVLLDDTIARAELAQAQASLVLSKANHQRAVNLYKRGAGTARARDEALAKLRNDQAAVDLARAKLDKMTIVAPFEGIVGLRKVDIGDFVNVGQELVNLEQVDPMKVDFRVPEIYVAAVRTGQQIEISIDAWPDRTFPGTVYAIDPLIDASGRSILIRARVPNPDGILRPGLFARVRLILTVRENAVLIPEQAIVPVGEAKFVYRVIGGKAVNTRVEIGARQPGIVEVVSGVKPGEMVITAGQMKIRPGMPVHVMPTAGATPAGGPAPAAGQAPAKAQPKPKRDGARPGGTTDAAAAPAPAE